jgi:hypothetical protein
VAELGPMSSGSLAAPEAPVRPVALISSDPPSEFPYRSSAADQFLWSADEVADRLTIELSVGGLEALANQPNAGCEPTVGDEAGQHCHATIARKSGPWSQVSHGNIGTTAENGVMVVRISPTGQ